jgi:hypothetical protein
MTLMPGEHKYQPQPAAATERKSSATDAYKAARPIILWVLAALGTAALGTSGWAHKTLWDHDGSIKVQGEWQRAHDASQGRADEKLERRLDRLEAKIDALMSQGRRP